MDDLKTLIPVSYDNPERPTVSGRELHDFLEVKSKYADWFKNMSAYGFTENIDYVSLSKNLENGGRSIDHQLTIPMAKELCMIQRNERGKYARQYFLAIEAQWNSPEAVMRRAVLIAQKQNDQLKAVNKQLLAENSEMEPWAKFGKAYHSSPENSMLLREFAANVLKPNGIPLGEKDLFKYFEDHGYLVKNKKAHDYHRPTEKAGKKMFTAKPHFHTASDGVSLKTTWTPYLTPEGQKHWLERFSKEYGQTSLFERGA
nr:MAG TPA: AntA/AntB antirepressor [Caudoviricetes sp.]